MQSPFVNLYKHSNFVLSHGEGMYIWDTSGKKYLDFGSGIAVNALGHANQKIINAIVSQAGKLIHGSNAFLTEPVQKLAQKLVESSFASAVFFCNSGTEANEAAIKFARKYNLKNGHEKRKTLVAFEGCFHGRTLGSLSITSKEKYRKPFEPLLQDILFLKFNNIDDLNKYINDSVAAVFVEPIQGEAGVRAATPEFLKTLEKKCHDFDIPLIADEIQCGMGRTGTLWAHTQWNITPDIMCLAKPLGGGIPCGAVLTNEKIASSLEIGDHGSTFGGNPIACAAGLAVFNEIMNEAFLTNVINYGHELLTNLQELQQKYPQIITAVRGHGFMCAMDFNIKSRQIIEACYKHGTLIVGCGDFGVRILPPLICTSKHIAEFKNIFIKAIDEILVSSS